MAGMPNPNAAQFPASNNFPKNSTPMEVGLARSKRQFVNSVGGEIVTNVEHTRPLVALPAIHVFRSVCFTAARCSVIDRMREGVAAFRKTGRS